MTLTEFLLARVADDEEYARDWVEHDADHDLTRFGSGRIFDECAAKRQIVENHVSYLRTIEGRTNEGLPANAIERDARIQRYALLHLAAVYASHPDYDQEWRP